MLSSEDNDLNRNGNGVFSNIVAVEFKVVSRTTEHQGETVTFDYDDGPSVTVDHPVP